MESQKQHRRGITRTEVLVVVICLGFLAMLLSVWLLRQQFSSRQVTCQSRQINTTRAILEFHKQHGHFPYYRQPSKNADDPPASWVVAVRPHFSQNKPSPTLIRELICPADLNIDARQPRAWMSTVLNTGMPDALPSDKFPTDWRANGVFLDGSAQPRSLHQPTTLDYLQQHDGAEFTLLLSENVDAGDWTDTQEASLGFVWVDGIVDGRPSPGDRLLRINQRTDQGDGSMRFARPSSHHPAGVNVVFANGRTEFLQSNIDYQVFVRLMTPNDAQLTTPGSNQLLKPPYRTEAVETREK